MGCGMGCSRGIDDWRDGAQWFATAMLALRTRSLVLTRVRTLQKRRLDMK